MYTPVAVGWVSVCVLEGVEFKFHSLPLTYSAILRPTTANKMGSTQGANKSKLKNVTISHIWMKRKRNCWVVQFILQEFLRL